MSVPKAVAIVAVVLGCTAVAGLLAVAVAVVVLNRAPAVPADFRAPATLPSGHAPLPEGTIAFDSDRTGNFEIYTQAVPAEGAGASGPARRLTSDPRWDSWWARISPDRTTILFYRTPAGTHDRDYAATNLWAMRADGSDPVLVRPAGLDGWVQQGHAEWAPDGRSIVMFGGSRTNPQIFVTAADGQDPRQVTDRPGTNIDPAFSPDGATIVFVGCPAAVCTPGDYEIYSIAASGGPVTRLTQDDLRDHDPYLSPDGTRLAWLTQVSGGLPGVWDVRVAAADGTGARRLVGDEGVTSKPEWSRDGSVLFFHRIPPGGTRFALFAARPDGTGLRPVGDAESAGSANEYPST